MTEDDGDLLTVKIAVKVQQMHFEHGLAAVSHRGPIADVGRTLQKTFGQVFVVDLHIAGIDPVQGKRLSVQFHIAGGKAQIAPELLTFDDSAGNAVGPVEQQLHQLEIALLQLLAHKGAADAHALVLATGRLHQLEAVAVAVCLQHGEIPAPLVTKAKVIADDQADNAQPLHQKIFDIALGTLGLQAGVETQLVDHVNALRFQQRQLLFQLAEPCRALLGRAGKEFFRMRFNQHHHPGHAELGCLVAQLLQNQLMTSVHAVELADGGNTGLVVLPEPGSVLDDFHGL